MRTSLFLIVALLLTSLFVLPACGTDKDGGEKYEPVGDKKILVAYFSISGNTKRVAEYAKESLGADLYEIVPEEPYTSADVNYNNADSRSSRENADDTARPAIKGSVANMNEYDVVIIAHPIWWGKAPKIIYTFVESYDFSGKTLTTMCTSSSSPLGNSAENLKKLTSKSTEWLQSKRFSSGAGKSEVESWLKDVELLKSASAETV